MSFLIFDTETTGLTRNWKASMRELNNWPRVIQLAWILFNENGNELNRGKDLIKPDGWAVPSDTFWIENGFSQEQSMLKGIAISNSLDKFLIDLNECTCLVSHNMSFDYNVLGAEMIRANKSGKKVIKICTKEASTNYCRLPGNYGKYKWPKLIELHQHLFNQGFDDAHDALADVIACARCFFELVKRNIIIIHNYEQRTVKI